MYMCAHGSSQTATERSQTVSPPWQNSLRFVRRPFPKEVFSLSSAPIIPSLLLVGKFATWSISLLVQGGARTPALEPVCRGEDGAGRGRLNGDILISRPRGINAATLLGRSASLSGTVLSEGLFQSRAVAERSSWFPPRNTSLRVAFRSVEETPASLLRWADTLKGAIPVVMFWHHYRRFGGNEGCRQVSRGGHGGDG